MDFATLLIVDDDEHLVQGLRLTLRRTCRVRVAERAQEALELMEHEKVDLVVSDHLMPGMTGLDFLRQVAARHPDTVRIMLTGHADPGVFVEAINTAGVFQILQKPIETAALKGVLASAWNKLLAEREARDLLELAAGHPELAPKAAALHAHYRGLAAAVAGAPE